MNSIRLASNSIIVKQATKDATRDLLAVTQRLHSRYSKSIQSPISMSFQSLKPIGKLGRPDVKVQWLCHLDTLQNVVPQSS